LNYPGDSHETRKEKYIHRGCVPSMNPAVLCRYLPVILLVLLLCCGNAAASDDDERELFYNELRKAMALEDEGNTDQALRIIDGASEKYLHTNWSYTLCGQLVSGMDADKQALRYFDQALEIDPAYARAWHYKGKSLSNLNRPGEAEVCLIHAGELDPRYEVPWTDKWPYRLVFKNLVAIFAILGFGGLIIYVVKREGLLR